jgi:hypothetical protein
MALKCLKMPSKTLIPCIHFITAKLKSFIFPQFLTKHRWISQFHWNGSCSKKAWKKTCTWMVNVGMVNLVKSSGLYIIKYFVTSSRLTESVSFLSFCFACLFVLHQTKMNYYT